MTKQFFNSPVLNMYLNLGNFAEVNDVLKGDFVPLGNTSDRLALSEDMDPRSVSSGHSAFLALSGKGPGLLGMLAAAAFNQDMGKVNTVLAFGSIFMLRNERGEIHQYVPAIKPHSLPNGTRARILSVVKLDDVRRDGPIPFYKVSYLVYPIRPKTPFEKELGDKGIVTN